MGYNSDLTQNQNAFKSIASNLLGDRSVNTEFSNETIPYNHKSKEKNRNLETHAATVTEKQIQLCKKLMNEII